MIGKLPENVLASVLETLPVEFSVLDANDKVMAWNRHDTRIFKRPEAVLGRDVRQCHPPKSLDKVLRILDEMKAGKREKARFWIDLKGKPFDTSTSLGTQGKKVMIEYYALRDNNGTYLGCLEASQDITEIQKLEGEKRLLD